MKKIIVLFTLFFLASCKKETNNQKHNFPTNPRKINVKTVASKTASVDTIFFSYDAKKYDDYVLATLLNEKYLKDSVCVTDFKLDFIQNHNVVYSHNIQIKGLDKDSNWYGNFELDSISSPLRTLTLGFEACGYAQHNYMFYINDKNTSLVHQWESMFDSGWGTWGQIVSGTPQNFYFRTESLSPEGDNEDMGIAEYSDSTHFELKNNKWDKTVLTDVGKIYQSKKMSLNQFYEVKN